MWTTRQQTDPLAPLETGMALAFAGVVGSVFGGGAAGVGPGAAVLAAVQDGAACVRTASDALPSAAGPDAVDLAAATVTSERAEVCLTDPSWVEQGLAVLGPVGVLAVLAVAFLLLDDVLRHARRVGPFTPGTVSRARRLGWFLVAGTLVWPLVASAAAGLVVVEAVPGSSWFEVASRPEWSAALAVVGLGLVSLARVLQRAAVLQQDYDATV